MHPKEQTTQKIFIAQSNLFGLWQAELKLDLAELKKLDATIDNNLKAKIKPYLAKEISALQARLDNFDDDYYSQRNKKAVLFIVKAIAIGLVLGGGLAAMGTCVNRNEDYCSRNAPIWVPFGLFVGVIGCGAVAFPVAWGNPAGMSLFERNAMEAQRQTIRDQLDEWKAVDTKLDINVENELKLVTVDSVAKPGN